MRLAEEEVLFTVTPVRGLVVAPEHRCSVVEDIILVPTLSAVLVDILDTDVLNATMVAGETTARLVAEPAIVPRLTTSPEVVAMALRRKEDAALGEDTSLPAAGMVAGRTSSRGAHAQPSVPLISTGTM